VGGKRRYELPFVLTRRHAAYTKSRFSEYIFMALYLTVFVRFLSSASLPVGFCVWPNLTDAPCGGGVVAANTGSYKASDDSPPNCCISALSVFLLSSPPSVKYRNKSIFYLRTINLKKSSQTQFPCVQVTSHFKFITCVQVSMYLRRRANSCATLHKMAIVNPELFASIFL